MLSSMQNKYFNMLFIPLTVVILFTTLRTGSATNLPDLPLKIPSKSSSLQATLIDSSAFSSAYKYSIQEYISTSDSSTRGKIVISGEKDSYNVYYNTESDINNQRLVIQGTNCLPLIFDNKWDNTIPGISKPVTNLVLLMGPSIIYRLGYSSVVWKSVKDKYIRGTMMTGVTTDINKRLQITYYYKKHFDSETGIMNPSRIEFSGYDPYSIAYSFKENLILEIYSKNENYYDELVNEVQLLPGIGCPHYLSSNKIGFPSLKVKYLHYTMYEHIEGSTTSQTFSEIHASEEHKILKLKSTLLGVTSEVIYDYGLGVSYLFQEEGSCSMLAADLSSPGINDWGFFYLNSLLEVDQSKYNFQYIGKLNLEHRSGISVNAWEKVKYNVIINGKNADKAVITQYFAKLENSGIFYRYTLVSTTITIYKLDSLKNSYTFTDRITRDYMNFENDGSEEALYDIFTLKGCKYLTSDKTLTLGFQFQCKGESSSCAETMGKYAHLMKEDLMHYVIGSKTISPLRIDSVEHNFNDGQFEVEVTFLDTPNLQYIFNSKAMSISASTFNKMKKVEASDEFDCLDKCAKVFDNIIVVLYRPSDSSCGYLTDFGDLEEDTKVGKPCSIYHFPLKNLRAIDLEVPLDKIHDQYLENLEWSISFSQATFKMVDIVDKTVNKDSSFGGLNYRSRAAAKLINNDGVTINLPDVKSFADCYRNCHDSEQIACNTFSFCENGDSIDCRVSSLLTEAIKSDVNIEQDDKCAIYSLNILNDYSKVRQRKFKSAISTQVEKSLYDCAESCHASPDCLSFQHCGRSWSCSFGNLYTDATTEYDEACSIYFPKVTQEYQNTGNKIVSEMIHTEDNLNFEQCASLCHGWSDGDIGCKSFNFCPKSKTESSCSLTKFSIKSSDTKTVDGGECSNYELKEESNEKKKGEFSSTEVIKGTSSSGAFGIIMLFLFVGALLGFITPLVYDKVKNLHNSAKTNESFTWTKQTDEPGENFI